MERQRHAGQTTGLHRRSRISLTLDPGYNNAAKKICSGRTTAHRKRALSSGFMAAGFLAAAALTNSHAQQRRRTLLIRGATIIDGTPTRRSRSFNSDRGNTIVACCPANADARRAAQVIDLNR